mgnify:CR=1 FL=1
MKLFPRWFRWYPDPKTGSREKCVLRTKACEIWAFGFFGFPIKFFHLLWFFGFQHIPDYDCVFAYFLQMVFVFLHDSSCKACISCFTSANERQAFRDRVSFCSLPLLPLGPQPAFAGFVRLECLGPSATVFFFWFCFFWCVRHSRYHQKTLLT